MAGRSGDEGEAVATQLSAKGPRTISSRYILGNDKVVIIQHEDEMYRLQRTTAGKLILTK